LINTESKCTWYIHAFSDFNFSLNSALATVARQLRLEQAIVKAVDREEFEEARKPMDEALLVEINETSNDASMKALLYRHPSRIDEAHGQWEDALRNFDEAGRLEMSIGVWKGALLEKEDRRFCKLEFAVI
jgi:hypothetical protein